MRAWGVGLFLAVIGGCGSFLSLGESDDEGRPIESTPTSSSTEAGAGEGSTNINGEVTIDGGRGDADAEPPPASQWSCEVGQVLEFDNEADCARDQQNRSCVVGKIPSESCDLKSASPFPKTYCEDCIPGLNQRHSYVYASCSCKGL